jgi:hypothetical protein
VLCHDLSSMFSAGSVKDTPMKSFHLGKGLGNVFWLTLEDETMIRLLVYEESFLVVVV